MNQRLNTLLSEKDIKTIINGKKFIVVELNDDERSMLYGVEEVFECGFSLSTDFQDGEKLPPMIKITVSLTCSLIDNYTFKLEKETFIDSDEVILYGDNEEDLVERVGKDYDFRPTFLAILYTLIPIAYTKETEFKKANVNGFEVMTESEYLKKKKEEKKASPFDNLNEKDFE